MAHGVELLDSNFRRPISIWTFATTGKPSKFYRRYSKLSKQTKREHGAKVKELEMIEDKDPYVLLMYN